MNKNFPTDSIFAEPDKTFQLMRLILFKNTAQIVIMVTDRVIKEVIDDSIDPEKTHVLFHYKQRLSRGKIGF